jgi:hypothetical protein
MFPEIKHYKYKANSIYADFIELTDFQFYKIISCFIKSQDFLHNDQGSGFS